MSVKSISLAGKTFEVEGRAVPLEQIIPNADQPRMEPKIDIELMRSIQENRGVVVPLLIEPLTKDEKERFIEEAKKRWATRGFLDMVKDPLYLIVDGERRWANCMQLLKDNPEETKEYASVLPCDVIKQPLSTVERLMIWIFIHRNRKDWKRSEREKAVYDLVGMTSKEKAAATMGVSLRKIDKWLSVYELATTRFKKKGPAAISYARELLNIRKSLMDEEVKEAVINKVNSDPPIIKTPVAIRELRKILRNAEAKEEFLKPDGTIESALVRIEGKEAEITEATRFKDSIIRFRKIVSKAPWTDLYAAKGDKDLLSEIDYSIGMLKKIKEALQ